MKKRYLAFVVAAMMVVLSACGGGSNDGKTPANSTNKGEVTNSEQPSASPTTEASAEPSEEPSQEPSQEPSEKPEATAHKPGEKFTFGDWEITLDSFEFNQKVSSDMFSSSADEGNKFIVMNYSVTNNGKEAKNFTNMIGGVDIKAMFKGEYEYNHTITMIDGDLSMNSIKPLSSKKGFVVIEVPDTVADGTDSLVLELTEDKNKALITLR